MLRLTWLQLFIRIFFLLLIILFIMPILIDDWFFYLGDNLFPRGNAVLVYKNYTAESCFWIEFAGSIRKLILFM